MIDYEHQIWPFDAVISFTTEGRKEQLEFRCMQESIFFDTFTLTPLHVQLGEEKLHLYNFNMEKLTNPVIRYLCQASYLLQSLSCLTRSQEIIHDQHTIRWSKELRGHVEVSRGRLPCK